MNKIFTKKRAPLIILVSVSLISCLYLFDKLTPPPPSTSIIPTQIYPTTVIQKLPSAASNSLYNVQISDNNTLFALDKSLELVRYASGSSQKIYPHPITNFSQAGSMIAVVEKAFPDKISILDYSGKVKSVFSLPDIKSISYMSLSDDIQNLYFLSNYDVVKNKSLLFTTRTELFRPQLIMETSVNKVESLTGNLLVLFQMVDYPDSSYVSVYDLATGANIIREKCNSYVISPNKDFLLVQTSNTIKIIDILKRLSKITSSSNGDMVAWKNPKTLIILSSGSSGTEVSYLDAESLQVSKPTLLNMETITNLTRILAVNDQLLLVTDNLGVIWKIDL
jgi:hypothetical protein